MSVAGESHYHPWPFQEIRERLCSEDTLRKLCRPRTASNTHDIREFALEDLARDLMIERFGRPPSHSTQADRTDAWSLQRPISDYFPGSRIKWAAAFS
jgi:hypothetical protein